MGGYTRIYETDEWRRAFYDLRGRASFIGLQLDNYWFYLSEKMTIVVFRRIDRPVLRRLIKELFRRLLRANALEYSSTP